MQSWVPEFIPYACPFVAAPLIGPSMDIFRMAKGLDTTTHGLHANVMKLILKRIGIYWGIGNSALGE